ncbi:formate dehydrogenase accessory sulfurtransferase FdhD [Microbacterium sp. C7(2022)]|uniref:formate dehydrogenase accessory sulfurtransferase FdhD n=1 Tax=Microbacterium sp. C7(2022) TaxID=2992759 RepID=UPI00237A756C|nr:formate dehydrogenase accessory sulfurtransferase FdhD [Microbacterium sp. C7(2022)]MDE0546057.1 formate dehydrogenase accessory sulfurtransferase FdhD [Microbacterium sp. C7(2022)]
MGRITANRPVTRISFDGDGEVVARRRADVLAVEEPLEIRLSGQPLVVTMRTPGHDVELAAGFLVSEGVIGRSDQLAAAIHCGGPGLGAQSMDRPALLETPASGNTYNVLDVTLGAGAVAPTPDMARAFVATSACGVCGAASIDAVEKSSRFDVAQDMATMDAAALAELPERLRVKQAAFAKTGGLHAAGLYDAASGEELIVREDVGRHNAVDKVVGWALTVGRLPLTGTVLQVSGRVSFELVQKAAMAGIPILAAVSAPSSLAVELAAARGLTLVGFSRGDTLNVYTHPERIRVG